MDTVIDIGDDAPEFTLTDLNGQAYSSRDLQERIIVLNFWSAECEWCERIDHELTGYMKAWKDNVKIMWIASNASEPRTLIEKVAADRMISPVLVDSNQKVADLYGAQTTPHFFIIDSTGKLVYQGAWDNITFRQRVATQLYVPKVIEALLAGVKPQVSQTQPYGCVLVRFTE